MAPTCQSLSLSSPCFSLCCTVRSNGAPSSPEAPTAMPCRRGGRSRFPGRRASPSRPRRLPELATCLHSRSRSPSSSSPSSVRHEWRLSSSRSSADSASFFPWILNPSHPNLLHLPSFLPSPSKPSSKPYLAGNRSFSGRQPLEPPELHLNVELPPPVLVSFAPQLKSTLGEALMLVLSLFFHVHQVSTRVLDHAATGRAARRRRCSGSSICHLRMSTYLNVCDSSFPLSNIIFQWPF